MLSETVVVGSRANGSLKARFLSSGKRSADRCTLVFDTDSKRLYVEREVAHLEATVDYRTATMEIADYLQQGGQTAGHRELWRLLRTLFKETSDADELIE